jgi:cyclopropane-fatty-acyl-phospholipid synthase
MFSKLNQIKELWIELIEKIGITEDEMKIVKEEDFYKRLSSNNDISINIGEAYMAGEWVSKDLALFFRKIFGKPIDNFGKLLLTYFWEKPVQCTSLLTTLLDKELKNNWNEIISNNQSVDLSKNVGEQHYDIPDILYEYMLDPNRQYTCGYWKPNTFDLETSQINKINLIIDKLQIPDNVEMNIVDIGCGWGGLTNAISERYPLCKITGISISKEQIKNANIKYNKNPNLKYLFLDYRDLPKQDISYDRIVSVGMFEHVGFKNYNTFFNVCNKILKTEGICLIHTITKPLPDKFLFGSENYSTDPWIDKYIFPGGYIPQMEQVLSTSQSERLMCHHIQNLSISYAKTLKEWYNNFKLNWQTIQKSNPTFFTDKFYNMWEFYLLCSMVNFEVKQLQLTQFILTKNEFPEMYIFTEKK